MKQGWHCWQRPVGAALAALVMVLPRVAAAQAFSGDLLDAVRLTLHHDAALAVSRQQIVASEGLLLSARAPFDTLWNVGISQQRTYTPQPSSSVGGVDLLARQTGYKAGFSRRLESGIVINPVLSVDRIRDDGLNSTAPSTGNVAINFVFPLLKGRGTEVNTAPVTSAALALDAARYGYRHTLSLSVVRTVTAYWDVVAARQTLELARLAESRAGQLLANARKLAKADEIPTADLLKYEVRRVAQESDRLRVEQQVIQAVQALAQAINVPIEALNAPPLGFDPFPLAQAARLTLLENETALARLLASSAERRLDLRAAEQRLHSARTLADAAQRNSGTQLDLALSVGYNGIAEGRSAATALRALGYPARGPNVALTLNYTLPTKDFEGRGLILQREAAAEQARIELDALRLRVAGDMRTQLESLRAAIRQLDKASLQQRLQTTIYDNEKRSYQAGLSSLLELFTTESQLTTYQTEWVQAQRNFAQALILFRHQTASLLQGDQDGLSLQAATLTALPDAAPLTDISR